MLKRSLLAILLAAGALAPAANAHAQTQQPPAGSIGIRLLEAPVDRQEDPRARIYIIDHLAQGATISRRFEVVNITNSPQTISLYAGAATPKDGDFVGSPG